MFVINPDPYSLPSYRIGPFRTSDLSLNHNLPVSYLADEYFNERFSSKDLIYTINGRKAINIALGYYNLDRDDVVTIFTTSGNFYISGCVTREIESFCKWSRKIEPETKIILVNHEFGYPFPDLHTLKKYGLPIIEDCAGSFFSHDKYDNVGNIGDFVIYSFPKMFPLQIGGLLVSNLDREISREGQADALTASHIRNVVSHYIGSRDEIIKKRISNFNYLKEKFGSLGLQVRFKDNDGVVPGVFMFETGNRGLDLTELKKYYYEHGVQCSVFYGEEAFFIPVHQALNEHDMNYFYEVIKSFVNKVKL